MAQRLTVVSLLNFVDKEASGNGVIVLEFGSDPDQGFPLVNDNCCFVLSIAQKGTKMETLAPAQSSGMVYKEESINT